MFKSIFSKQFIVIKISIVIFFLSWMRICWQASFYVSPARTMEYETTPETNWARAGFPSCSSPVFVDGSSVWKLSDYGDHSTVENGFARFDLETGIAQMKWKFFGKNIRILGLAKHKNGSLAILRDDLGDSDRLIIETLNPQGGIVPYGKLPIQYISGLRGFAWVNDRSSDQ